MWNGARNTFDVTFAAVLPWLGLDAGTDALSNRASADNAVAHADPSSSSP